MVLTPQEAQAILARCGAHKVSVAQRFTREGVRFFLFFTLGAHGHMWIVHGEADAAKFSREAECELLGAAQRKAA